jgi:hypothetical protein
MAKGYHSRSPEEFKEYLQNLQNTKRKKNWKQILIFIDIILLMLIFYFVYQNINPGIMNSSGSSGKVTWNQASLSLTASQYNSSANILTYLLVENSTNSSFEFPEPGLHYAYYWKSEKRETCKYSKYDIKIAQRTIQAKSSTVIEIPIPSPDAASKIYECSKEYLSEKSKFGIGALKSKILFLGFIIQDKENNETVLEIPSNPFR